MEVQVENLYWMMDTVTEERIEKLREQVCEETTEMFGGTLNVSFFVPLQIVCMAQFPMMIRRLSRETLEVDVGPAEYQFGIQTLGKRMRGYPDLCDEFALFRMCPFLIMNQPPKSFL